MRHSFILIALGITLSLPADAEIYQWRDSQGRLHFGDKPAPGVGAKPKSLDRLNTMTPVKVPENLFERADRPDLNDSAVSLPRLKHGSVVMYSTPTCTYCGAAKDYMAREGIAYRERDITASKSARQEFAAYGGRGVPLMLIGTRHGTELLHGFSEARFEAVYGQP